MRRISMVIAGVLITGTLVWQARTVLQAEPAVPAGAAEPGVARIRAEGRLVTYPGGEVTVSSEVQGRIVRLPVEEGTRVRAGQLLLELAADEEQAALAEASAQLAEAEATARLADSEEGRQRRLAEAQVVSAQSLDRVVREQDAAHARREVAQATIRRLEARLAKSRVVSPIGGVVVAREVEPGEIVAPGRALLTVAELGHTRVEAEVDEFDASRLKVGAPVTISGEGYEQRWRGRVEEIPSSVSARRLKPQDPGRPTDTRVLIVKVALDEPLPLRLGQRVEVEIEGRE